eukprot:701043-Pyramimonas_sp.AAC.1
MGKDAADSGEVMMMIYGAPVEHVGKVKRFVFGLAGTFYSPKVFEIALCDFHDRGLSVADDVDAPFLVAFG